MWEWSNKKNTASQRNSLANAYNDLLKKDGYGSALPQPRSGQTEAAVPLSDSSLLKSENMKLFLEQKIKKYGLRNIILEEHAYQPQTWDEMDKSFAEYRKIRKMFLKMLGYSHEEECRKLGLDDDDIMLLRRSISPENYNTHIKFPLDFGGILNINNIALVKTNPHHELIHRLIDIQIEKNYLKTNKKIFIPYFEGKIYYD